MLNVTRQIPKQHPCAETPDLRGKRGYTGKIESLTVNDDWQGFITLLLIFASDEAHRT